MTPNERLELHIQQALADLSACRWRRSWQPRDIASYLTDALQVVQGVNRDQPPYLERVMEEDGDQHPGIGDSPSVREPPPVEASPSPRERSAVGAKRPLDLLSAASVLASGMDSDDEHGKCGHCTRTRCWCQ